MEKYFICMILNFKKQYGGQILYYIVFVIIISLVIILLYYMLIIIDIKYKRSKENDIIIFQMITGFGLIKYNLEIPYIDFLKNVENIGIRYKVISKSLISSRDSIGFRKMDTVYDIIEIINQIKLNYDVNKKSITYLMKKARVNDVIIKISFGFEDAFNTALFYGILSTLIINILVMLKKKLKMNIEEIDLRPVFAKDVLKVEFGCIIEVRLGHIITGIRKMRNIAKGSVAYGTAYTSINENNPWEY